MTPSFAKSDSPPPINEVCQIKSKLLQIELVTTFADQVVIAIENSRLFEEVQARTRELAKTVEDLEVASQHKNQFVANMSRELRTPLAAILEYAELIQEGFYGPLPEKSMDALTRIRSNGKHEKAYWAPRKISLARPAQIRFTCPDIGSAGECGGAAGLFRPRQTS